MGFTALPRLIARFAERGKMAGTGSNVGRGDDKGTKGWRRKGPEKSIICK